MIPGWLAEVEEEVAACFDRTDRMSARELAQRLGVSEASAVAYIALLAAQGRLVIEGFRLAASPAPFPGD